MTTKAEIHAELCTILNDTYIRKNADYGDSFAKLRDELPNSILVRVYDKYSRLKNLLEGADLQVLDESIDDTLLDLANYCIMELIERSVESDSKSVESLANHAAMSLIEINTDKTLEDLK